MDRHTAYGVNSLHSSLCHLDVVLSVTGKGDLIVWGSGPFISCSIPGLAPDYVVSVYISSLILVLVSGTESAESHAYLKLTILHPLLPSVGIAIPNLTVVSSCRQFPLYASTSVWISSITMDLIWKKPGHSEPAPSPEGNQNHLVFFLRDLLPVFPSTRSHSWPIGILTLETLRKCWMYKLLVYMRNTTPPR